MALWVPHGTSVTGTEHWHRRMAKGLHSAQKAKHLDKIWSKGNIILTVLGLRPLKNPTNGSHLPTSHHQWHPISAWWQTHKHIYKLTHPQPHITFTHFVKSCVCIACVSLLRGCAHHLLKEHRGSPDISGFAVPRSERRHRLSTAELRSAAIGRELIECRSQNFSNTFTSSSDSLESLSTTFRI